MPKIEQGELRKKDKLIVRSGQNDEVQKVIFPNGLQVGLPTQNFNHGIGLQNLDTAPNKTTNALYAVYDVLYFNGSAVDTGGGGGATPETFWSSEVSQSIFTTGSAAISGTLDVVEGITGSLTLLNDGTSYLKAGSNVTITSGTNGSVTIASTGARFEKWDPSAPPETAGDLDDEFRSALAGWTTFDPGSSGMTTVITNQGLLIDQPVIAGDKIAGVFKQFTTQSADYEHTFWSKWSWLSEDFSDYPGVFLWIGAADIVSAPSTSKIWTINLLREATAFYIDTQEVNNYSSFASSTPNAAVAVLGATVFGRIRVSYDLGTDTTTFSFDYSGDGVGWFKQKVRTISGHLSCIGVGVNNTGGSSKLHGTFEFFRSRDDADFFYVPSGSMVTKTKA